ncbi:MAG TPA: sensor domain-containing diguanylate cyclase, partial [Thermoanaerobaculia bacterium]|nr:sensor domain-containing diguanylate cyclase [Thermoanaerobaculia bacterium]
ELVPEATIVIADRDQLPFVPQQGNYACRIVLDSGRASDERDTGDLVLDPDAFTANPRPALLICRDLARSRRLVSQLLGELEFSQHIHELVAIADFDSVSERIVRTVGQLVDAPHGTLLLHDPRIERFVIAYSNDPDFHDTGDFMPGISTQLLEDALAAPDGFSSEEGNVTPLLFPIRTGEDLVGVLRLVGRGGERFDPALARKAVRYLDGITVILSNLFQLTRSNELAMRDDLTKAYNRRFFEAYLEEEIERSRRYGTFFSIIFLDLDELKRVNNLYGHLAGSRTLQEVAKRILSAVRTIDKVVRFGGDEFCIILPQTDQEQARSVANRVRRAIVESSFRIESDVQVEITASFGIATFPVHATGKEDLIRQADAAMYRVKSTTKDSVGMAEIRQPGRRPA